ncbi:MAG: DUF262 domain-containing protein [Methylocystis sp.]
MPEFQRTFVWDQDRILRLWDSLYRGFPIGQLMLWEPSDVDFPMRGFGRRQTEIQPSPGTTAVIDGQQRLSALYLVLIGEVPLRFDLANEKFTYTESPNSLRLDFLRTSTGASVPFVEAMSRDVYFSGLVSSPHQSAPHKTLGPGRRTAVKV